MIDAALLVRDRAFQKFFRRASRIAAKSNPSAIVVLATGLGLETGEKCKSDLFALFDKANRKHIELKRVLELGFNSLKGETDGWGFSATYFDAYGEYAPIHDDDVVEYFGGVLDGRIRRTGHTWKSWVKDR